MQNPLKPFLHLAALLLAALVGQADAQTLSLPAFQPTGSLTTARYHHTATLLPNGRVLVTGGFGNLTGSYLSSTETYNPVTGVWSTNSSMMNARFVHTATLLNNGLVLVVGGYGGIGFVPDGGGSYLSSAELYNPATGTWTPTGSMSGPRYDHTATLLPNGKVLVAGGNNGPTMIASAELYDPVTGTWATTGLPTTARVQSTATLMTNGLVLIVGGRHVNNSASFSSAEIFNPATGTWSATGSLNDGRASHAATLLPNGMVLVASGYSDTATHSLLRSAELFNPVTGTWATSGSLNTARAFSTAALLPSGLVLVAGGADSSDIKLSSAELFSLVTGTWTNTSSLQAGRFHHTSTRLTDGRVLVVGGQVSSGGSSLPSTELFTESAALATLTTGLVAYYPFSGSANDESGNGNHGTVQEAAPASDRFTQASRAYSFDGVNDQILVAHSSSISPTNEVSVAAWIRPLAYEDNKHCVSKGSHVNYLFRSYSLQGPWADGKWRAALSTPSGEVVVASSNNAALSQWSQVLMTYAGGTVKLYVNGQLSGTQAATGLITQTSEGLVLGSHKFYAASDYWFEGSMDDVRIYNRALSTAEAAELYASEASGGSTVVPPAISAQPTNIITSVGGNGTFRVTATGTAPLIYQWVKDGANLPGATNASLVFVDAQANHAGNYTIVITNAAGSVTSSVARLTLLPTGALGSAPTATVAVFAGSGVAGNVDGSDLAAIRLNQPNGLGFLSSGVLIVADAGNHLLRIIYPPSVAGFGSGPYAGSGVAGFADAVDNTQARLNLPLGMVVGPGDDVFVADTMNNRIRRVSPGSSRTVSTVAGSGSIGLADAPGVFATFNFPNDLVMDPDGNIFVTEFNNHVIRKIAPGGATTIFAGNGTAGSADGQGTAARFNGPGGIARGGDGTFYVTDYVGHRIRKISAQGMVTTVAGDGVVGLQDGPATAARFNNPDGIVVDSRGDLYVADSHNHTIRRITPNGRVETIAGNGIPGTAIGAGASARFTSPGGIALGPDGKLYVADTENHRICAVSLGFSAPSILSQPSPATLGVGESYTLAVTCAGTSELRYQWRLEGLPIAGATNTAYALGAAQFNQAGAYDVVVTNFSGSVTSSVAVLAVNRLTQTITFPAISTKTLGDAPFALGATASSGLTVSFSIVSGPATISGSTITLSGAVGTVVVRAAQGGDVNYNAAANVDQSFTVSTPTSGLTAVHGSVGYVVGGTASLHVRIDYPGTLTALGYEVVLPAGWSYASDTSTAGVKPAPGDQGTIALAWTSIPASPVEFDLVVNVPAGTSGEKTISAQVSIRQGGPEIRADATPNPLRLNAYVPYHSADTTQNWKFSLTELTRVISLYNYRAGSIRTGEFHAEAGTEDGYAAGPGPQTGRRHSADTSGNWMFSLTELTRVISLYNYREGSIRTGDYHPQAGTEDGYAPSPAVVGQALGVAGESGGQRGRLLSAAVETAALSTASQVYVPGQTLTVALQVTYEGTLTAYGWELDLPAGWSYVSDTGTTTVRPDVGQQGTLEWAWTGGFPASPTSFNVVLQVPVGQAGNKTLNARAILRDPLRTLTTTALTLSDAMPVPLAITTQPMGQTAVVGANVTFSVSATGQPPLTYQWRRESSDIPSATSSSLVLNAVTLAQGGAYRVVVTDAVGNLTSVPAQLVVTTSLFQPPAPQSTAAIRSQGFGLNLLLETGRSFRVQAATELINPVWTDVTNFISTGAAFQFIDAAATNQTRRFYRVVSP